MINRWLGFYRLGSTPDQISAAEAAFRLAIWSTGGSKDLPHPTLWDRYSRCSVDRLQPCSGPAPTPSSGLPERTMDFDQNRRLGRYEARIPIKWTAMAVQRFNPARRWGFLVGSAATAAGVVALAVGALDGLNDYGLDLCFRHLSTIKADPRIVLVDINDYAIEAVGDWPWPRRRYAQVVGVLDELGAKAIVLDLVLSDPSSPRVEHAGPGEHYDFDTDLAAIGDPTEDPTIYDDDELRDAMAVAGNVYLAMYFRLAPPEVDPSALLAESLELHKQRAGIGDSAFADHLIRSFPGAQDVFDLSLLYDLSRLITELQQHFGLDAEALTRRLGARTPIDIRQVEQHLPAAKRITARWKAAAYFAEQPDAEWPEFFEHVLPEVSIEVETPDRDDLLDAFRFQRSYLALVRASPSVPDSVAGRIAHAYDLTLPVDKLAKVARGIGFVSFPREQSGGVVRDIPLLAETEGTLLFQLGLLVAIDELGADRSATSFLPLGSDGSTLLMWHVPTGVARWQDSFMHIPAARVLEIALNREAAAENVKRLALDTADLVKLRHRETHVIYADYVRLVNQRRTLQEQLDHETDPDAHHAVAEALTATEAKIAEIQDDALLWLQRAYNLWKTTEPVGAAERTERAQILRLYEKFGHGQLETQVRTLNADLTARARSRLDELRPEIEGNICFVGYTASGMADLVTSPVYASMPGVMAHANVANMVLQGKAAYRAPPVLNGLMMLLVGMLMTGVAGVRGPIVSFVSLLVLALLAVGIGAYLFWVSGYYLASASAVAQACGVWAFVTGYRQFTEERSRRQFQRALAQYTSPAVAARIADRASARDLAPGPATVTCFFSDLKSFTRLSERLGAERTRLILNPYLRSMSAVLVEHHGLVNKFMGDGIFAFFNAPIWPCSNHSEQACGCALASQAALSRLNRDIQAMLGDEPLVMRIGLASGDTFVGDYGSDAKLDYTCIGDTVNLASRLEKACKALGTSILVNETTRRQAGNRFVYRPLGRLALPGKRVAVDVHELVGLRDTVDATAQAYIVQFEHLIRAYQACQWESCLDHLKRCRAMRNDDLALDVYREAASAYRRAAPRQDWDGALELTDS